MRQSRGLKELDLTRLDRNSALPISRELRILLKGDTPLERFKLTFKIDDAECRALIHALPSANTIKELTLCFNWEISVPKCCLLRAFEKNSSLVHVRSQFDEMGEYTSKMTTLAAATSMSMTWPGSAFTRNATSSCHGCSRLRSTRCR